MRYSASYYQNLLRLNPSAETLHAAIKALCDEVDRLHAELAEATEASRETDQVAIRATASGE